MSEYCGKDAVNFTASTGRLYIFFNRQATSLTAHKGYKLRISEILHKCSSETLYVDEHTKKAELKSPNYPHGKLLNFNYWSFKLLPTRSIVDGLWVFRPDIDSNSPLIREHLICKILATIAKMILSKFTTVHLKALRLLEGYFIEIFFNFFRYCNQNPPSTIFSTDSHLFVRFTTDSMAPSQPWNATYEIANCGGSVVLQPNVNTTVTSPNYPNVYPKDSCLWTLRAPKGHFIHAKWFLKKIQFFA